MTEAHDPTGEAGVSVTDGNDETGDEKRRLPAPLRLRSAGVGVILGGLLLGVVSLLVSGAVAGGLLVSTALGGGLATREEPVLAQLFLGVGAVGVLALVEVGTRFGLGLSAPELAVLAVVLGAVDVIGGTVLHLVHRRE